MDIDKFALISGDPLPICDGITLFQPTLRDIKEFGEAEFFGTFWTLCSAPWDMPATLDDAGIDFMEITEWDLFRGLITAYKPEQTKLFFGDVDFSQFIPLSRLNEDGNEDVVLCNSDGVVIDENSYKMLIEYIRMTISFQHINKKAGNNATKKVMIMDDRKRRKREQGKPFQSVIFDGIITLVNTEEFKYNYSTVMDITLYQYMKSFIQIQGKKAACALLQSSGFIDMSQIDKLDLQWVYSEEKYKPRARKLVNDKHKK